MPTQVFNGDYWTLFRHKNDDRVEYWATEVHEFFFDPYEDGHRVKIRATRNMLHPEWDEVPLEFTVDGGMMPFDAFWDLYQRVEEDE